MGSARSFFACRTMVSATRESVRCPAARMPAMIGPMLAPASFFH